MNVLVIGKGRGVGRPVIGFGKDTSDETPLDLPPGEYPDSTVVPVYGLKGLMFQAAYDPNNDGVVDQAQHVEWEGIQDPPFTFPTTIPEVAGLESALENLAASNPRQALMFEQATPSSVWTIDHNLGFKPDVALFTTDGVEFEANVMHTSVNQTLVSMNTPFAGFARLT